MGLASRKRRLVTNDLAARLADPRQQPLEGPVARVGGRTTAMRSGMCVRGAGLGVLIAVLASLSGASGAAAQVYEPNDSFIAGFGPVAAGTTYSAATETDNDEDYYFFYVPQRTQMFFNLTATNTADSWICAQVTRQTHSGYSYVDDTELGVPEGHTQTAAVTLDRGKYFFIVGQECTDAGETYTIRIDPPGATSTYEPFAAECAAAHEPVVTAGTELTTAKAALSKAKRRLANARARHASRFRLRLLKSRVATARATVGAAKTGFRAATAAEAAACSVPM
jgi:hypothetical protein